MVPLATTLASVLLFTVPARGDALDDWIAAARSKYVDALVELVDWGRGKGVSGFRHDVYARLLLVDGDHLQARRALKYRRRDGEWVQDARYTRPGDFDERNLGEGRRRLEAASDVFVGTCVQALESHEVDPDQREQILAELLALAPDSARLRAFRGDQLVDGRWLLPETAAGLAVRKELLAYVASRTPVVESSIVPDEARLSAGWRHAFRTRRRVVMGSEEEHLRRSLLFMDLGENLCAHLLGVRRKEPRPKTAAFFDTVGEAKSYLESLGAKPEDIADFDIVSGGTVDGNYVTYGDRNPCDGLRQVVSACLYRRFPKMSRGWVIEGVGQRITWYVSGDTGPNFFSPDTTERLHDDDAGGADPRQLPAERWLGAAADVLDRKGAEFVRGLLTKRLNAMEGGDVLVAYGLAAYLIEVYPGAWMAFVDASEKSHDVDGIVRDALQTDVESLTRRLRRWLRDAA